MGFMLGEGSRSRGNPIRKTLKCDDAQDFADGIEQHIQGMVCTVTEKGSGSCLVHCEIEEDGYGL